jgi:hypothetical protein
MTWRIDWDDGNSPDTVPDGMTSIAHIFGTLQSGASAFYVHATAVDSRGVTWDSDYLTVTPELG